MGGTGPVAESVESSESNWLCCTACHTIRELLATLHAESVRSPDSDCFEACQIVREWLVLLRKVSDHLKATGSVAESTDHKRAWVFCDECLIVRERLVLLRIERRLMRE